MPYICDTERKELIEIEKDIERERLMEVLRKKERKKEIPCNDEEGGAPLVEQFKHPVIY